MPLTRRTLLQGALAAPIVVSTSACERGNLIEPGARIIVVGAGFAGIAAARDLDAAGYEVIVLEARGRVGGRALSDESLGLPIDMGASWLHFGDRNPLAPFARESGIAFNVSDYENATIFGKDGLKAPAAEVFANVAIDERLEGALLWPYLRWRAGQMFGASGSGRTVNDVWQEAVHGHVAPLDEAAFRIILETQFAAPLDEVAVEVFFQDEEALPKGELFLTGGMQNLAAWLARGLDIRFGQDVRAIRWTADNATVETDAHNMECAGVVLTCSVGVLKSGDIALDPGLPKAHREVLDRLDMGLLNKIALRFPTPQWLNNEEFAVLTEGSLPSIVVNHHVYSGEPILLALTGGKTAQLLEEQNADTSVAALIRGIEAATGKRLIEPEDYAVWSWGTDPFALGSYVHHVPGANLAEGETLAEPVDRRLFLAGEALAGENYGTVAGAWLSGRRAAASIAGKS